MGHGRGGRGRSCSPSWPPCSYAVPQVTRRLATYTCPACQMVVSGDAEEWWVGKRKPDEDEEDDEDEEEGTA